jgi:hypothetical protein
MIPASGWRRVPRDFFTSGEEFRKQGQAGQGPSKAYKGTRTSVRMLILSFLTVLEPAGRGGHRGPPVQGFLLFAGDARSHDVPQQSYAVDPVNA